VNSNADYQIKKGALKNSKVVRDRKWTQNIAVGDNSFLEKIKDSLGIRAKGRKIHGGIDEKWILIVKKY